ncbi:MAG: aminodeoxychorismate/anthranilate synthase component II [Fimbriimonadaceae bacterium]|nr:aminodeoxychorismate/anthranilate synthase component II [Fimbriimonadaceae bacterium]
MILVIDNYDSFTYNLVQYVGQHGEPIVVRRNDEATLAEIEAMRPDGILLSPGPCTPRESGVCLDVLGAAIRDGKFAGVPIFGVCLGCQAVGFVAGGDVVQARNIMHGKSSMIRHDGSGVFAGMPNPFRAIRYHSLVVTADSIPADYVVTATSEDDHEVMGLRHRKLPIEGVQFHPESVLTEEGFRLVGNFVAHVRTARAAVG